MNLVNKANQYDIAEFSLRLVYAFQYKDSFEQAIDYIEALTVGMLAESNLKLLGARNTTNNQKTKPVWQPVIEGVSNDIYPHVARLLTTQQKEISQHYTLSSFALSILNNNKRKNDGLGLILSKSAIARLKTATQENPQSNLPPEQLAYVPFGIDNKPSIQLHLYNLGLAVLEVNLSPCQSYIDRYKFSGIQEFVYEVTHIRRKRGKKTKPRLTQQVDSENLEGDFDLDDLLNICMGFISSPDNCIVDNTFLASPPALNLQALTQGRYFSYSALRFKSPLNIDTNKTLSDVDLVNLSSYLAHRQTKDYQTLDLNEQHANCLIPFSNIVYYISNEGGAVIINDRLDKRVAHFNNYINDKLKSAYWPMALLAYVEFIYLVKFNSQINPKISFENPNEQDVEELETLRSKLLQFRLQYRFSQASQLQLHNKYYAKWRQTFESETLIKEISEDIIQVNSFLSYQVEKAEQAFEKERSNRLSILGIIATGMLSLLSLFGTNFNIYNNDSFALTSWLTFNSFIIASLITLFSVIVYQYYSESPDYGFASYFWKSLKKFIGK